MARRQRTVELSDGLVVVLEAPGVGYYLETFGGIPEFGLVEAAAIRRTGKPAEEKDFEKLKAVTNIEAAMVLVCHSAVKPKFSREPSNGFEDVSRVMLPDLMFLAKIAGELTTEAHEHAAKELNPTVAGPKES